MAPTMRSLLLVLVAGICSPAGIARPLQDVELLDLAHKGLPPRSADQPALIDAFIGQARRCSPADPKDLSALLVEIVKEQEVPGLACALIRDGRVVGLGASGVRRRGDETPVTTQDLWHLGSCTKAMTATLAARLVQQKRIAWDLTLAAAFEGIEVHPDLAAVTLEDLLAHRGGLLRDPMIGSLWNRLVFWPGSVVEARALVAREVLPLAPAPPPHGTMVYSNTGYMIAGAMLESATGKPWEQLLRKEVFEPLGMTRAGFGAPGTAGELTQPRGHWPTGAPVEPGTPFSDNPAALGPAGTVHATLEDWARFVLAHLQDETLASLHEPRDEAGTYGLGWLTVERKWAKGRVLTHSGSNGRWFCTVWAAPETGVALLAVCNQGGPKAQAACDQACVAMLAELDGEH
jgi:CubicO group peptidase (beta-lactamase class C family)